jgi:hypothetical protein
VKNTHFIVGLYFLLSRAHITNAQNLGTITSPSSIVNGETSMQDIFMNIGDNILGISSGIAVIILIIGGITYTLSGGDEEKEIQSKRTIKWALLGLAFTLISYVITIFITDILG